MGAFASACPTRKMAPAAPTTKRSTPEPVPAKVGKREKPRKDEKLQPAQTVMPLPTKSWRALLQETTLNPDAEPFHPKEVVPKRSFTPQSPPGLSNCHVSGSAQEDEPEWMQYLEKRLHAKASVGPSHARSKMSPVGRTASAVEPDKLTCNGKGGTSAIQTATYLEMLKAGPTPKKKIQSVSHSTSPVKGASHMFIAPRVEKPLAHLDLPLPMTTSSMETVEELRTRDDISVETMFVDQDLSDPAFWSETESLNIRKASARHIGRRLRAPKSTIRSYVMQDLNYSLDRSVGMLLGRLQLYADQQKKFSTTPENAAIPRRFVIGLKEVVRRIKQSKIECLIVAPDIQEDANSGGLDDRMREMLALTYQKKIPVIFALSRSRLGKALGKSLNISVLGVLDATGARQLFEDSVQLANASRQAWLARLGK